jgi:hypothetical protein
MFVVFDLDGTLANCEHRLHHIKGDEKPTPAQWDVFFAACEDDDPIYHTVEILKALRRQGSGIHVEIWSARSDQVREQTERWFYQRCDISPATLPIRMRRKGDHRNDDILKAEWIAEFGKPDLVFEDRARVVKMWRQMGVPCFQVADGEF